MNLLDLYNIRPSSSTVPSLTDYLSHLPGTMPDLARQSDSGNTLRSLIDKPPITSKQILPLSTTALSSFRLQPSAVVFVLVRARSSAQLPDNYASFVTMVTGGAQPTHEKHHKTKHKRSLDDTFKDGVCTIAIHSQNPSA